jgi:hypothetical protein
MRSPSPVPAAPSESPLPCLGVEDADGRLTAELERACRADLRWAPVRLNLLTTAEASMDASAVSHRATAASPGTERDRHDLAKHQAECE